MYILKTLTGWFLEEISIIHILKTTEEANNFNFKFNKLLLLYLCKLKKTVEFQICIEKSELWVHYGRSRHGTSDTGSTTSSPVNNVSQEARSRSFSGDEVRAHIIVKK